MDSTGFDITEREGSSSLRKWCVHINFWARGPTGVRELFFAELIVADKPDETLAVGPLGTWILTILLLILLVL
jgi:hypothetical protein